MWRGMGYMLGVGAVGGYGCVEVMVGGLGVCVGVVEGMCVCGRSAPQSLWSVEVPGSARGGSPAL